MTAGTMADTPVLGLDFDNTIVLYDDVFARLGQDSGLLPAGFSGGKRGVRAAIRALDDGEAKWTALQARVYGPGMALAVPSPGLLAFLARVRAAGLVPAIVSHKTEFAAADPGTNLRDSARSWIAAQGLTDPAGGGIDPALVFFESTRAEKIERIRALNCRWFVDDLDEVFLEPDFPDGTARLLFTPGGSGPAGPWRICPGWREVADVLGLPG